MQRHDFWDGRQREPWSLQPEDHLVYTACVHSLLPSLLSAGVNHQALCGPIFGACGDGQWIHSHRSWADCFRARSERALEEGYSHAAVSDVSGFFQNIGHAELRLELVELGVPPCRLERLFELLGFWFPSGKGVPWNLGSHVLAAALLSRVDRQLSSSGYFHLRMVDDVRVFCRSADEGRLALELLGRAFERLGLRPNLAKTAVVPVKSLVRHSAGKLAHQWIAELVTGATNKLERHSMKSAAHLPRAIIYHFLRQLYRPYLGYLTSRLTDLDTTLQGFAEGRIPEAYVHLLRDTLPEGNISARTLQSLTGPAVSGGQRSGLCRLILAEVGVRPKAPPKPPHSKGHELDRLETLLFLQLYPQAIRKKVLSKFEPRTFLEQRAFEALELEAAIA